jgi:uncharacterized phage infection (PIP) family protein YhgE
MSKNTSSRIFAGLTIFLCAIVLVISLAGVVGTWVAGRAVSDAAVQLLNGVDKAAGAARTMIAQVNTEVGQVRDQVTTVKTATDQLSQNVSDKGLVLTLIPPETDSELLTSVRKVAESVANIRGAVTSAIELYSAINKLPFVSLPQPDPENWGKVGDLVTTLQTGVQDLTAAITEFRSAASGAISKVTDGVSRVEGGLNNVETTLNSVDTQLAAAQAQAVQLSQTIPTALTVAMILITLFSAWVAYTQIVVMRGAWRKLRARSDSDTTAPSADVAG